MKTNIEELNKKFPKVSVRKVFLVGSKKYKSFAISLPIKWVRKKGIENVEVVLNDIAIIFPDGFPEDEKKKILEKIGLYE